MAVLSDQELWTLMGSGRLKIDPSPPQDFISPSAIDLRLASDFTRIKPPSTSAAVKMSIDTRNTGQIMEAIADLSTTEVIKDDECFTLKSGEFALAWTLETITMPDFLAARVEGKSTLARLGLSIHQSAPTVHATFSNRLQLELFNAGPFNLDLYPGEKICQLIVETMSMPSAAPLRSIHQRPSS